MIIHLNVLIYFVHVNILQLYMNVFLNLLNKSVSYKQNDMPKVMINCLVKLAQEKNCG